MFSRIHHIAIIVSNYEISKIFYTEVLGFKIFRESYRAERLSYKLDLILNDAIQIELFSFPSPPPRVSRPEACGLRHLAFSVDDLDASIEYLQAKGVILEAIRVDEFTGKRFVFFSDPDGLPIEIMESYYKI